MAADDAARSASDYVVDMGHGLVIDARRAGSEGRFANDYRGISAAPNARFKARRDTTQQ